jgi:hypothetical protein
MHGTGERPVHPVANLFPMMDGDELDELAADIAENGLNHAIVVDAEGVLLDGRNRLAACKIAHVEPKFVTLAEGRDPVAFIVSENVDRRHLTKGQRAIVLAMIYPEPTAYKRGGNSLETKELGFSAARLSQARAVLRHSRELAEAVLAGVSSFDYALSVAQEAARDAATAEKRLERLRAMAPDLADLIAEGRLTLDEALRTAEERRNQERMRRQTATAVFARSYSTFHPRGAPPAQWAEQIFRDVDVNQWPEPAEGVQLTPDGLEACARVLDEAARLLREGETNGEQIGLGLMDQMPQNRARSNG